MKALDTTRLTVTELPYELEFRIDREQGWFVLTALSVFSFVLLILSFTLHSLGLRIILAGIAVFIPSVIAFGFALTWHQVRTTRLTVTEEAFAATGYGLGAAVQYSAGSMLRSPCYEAVVPVADIRSLGYERGGEDSFDGLYVNLGHWKRCVLRYLNRRQCQQVTAVILRRYPEIGPRVPRSN